MCGGGGNILWCDLSIFLPNLCRLVSYWWDSLLLASLLLLLDKSGQRREPVCIIMLKQGEKKNTEGDLTFLCLRKESAAPSREGEKDVKHCC